jgi:hypothetical protein
MVQEDAWILDHLLPVPPTINSEEYSKAVNIPHMFVVSELTLYQTAISLSILLNSLTLIKRHVCFVSAMDLDKRM